MSFIHYKEFVSRLFLFMAFLVLVTGVFTFIYSMLFLNGLSYATSMLILCSSITFIGLMILSFCFEQLENNNG